MYSCKSLNPQGSDQIKPGIFIWVKIDLCIKMMIHAIAITTFPLLVLQKIFFLLIFHIADYVKLSTWSVQ
jgi:hypothetical protein